MQTDGNFVLYDTEEDPKFSTGTHGNPGSVLVFGQSCNFMVVSPDNDILWQSRDSCGEIRLMYISKKNFFRNLGLPTFKIQLNHETGGLCPESRLEAPLEILTNVSSKKLITEEFCFQEPEPFGLTFTNRTRPLLIKLRQ